VATWEVPFLYFGSLTHRPVTRRAQLLRKPLCCQTSASACPSFPSASNPPSSSAPPRLCARNAFPRPLHAPGPRATLPVGACARCGAPS
jgi:hypothetical protein